MSYKDFHPDLFLTFPWLNGSSSYLFQIVGISEKDASKLSLQQMVELLFLNYSELESRIMQFFLDVVESKEDFSSSTDDYTHLAMYPLLQIIISILGNRILANSLSNMYAKHCQFELRNTNKERNYSDIVIQNICQNIGIQCHLIKNYYIDGTKYPYRMDFQSYLKSATKMNNQEWKLINRPLISGYVYLIKNDIILLLREAVRQKTKPDFSQMDADLIEQLETVPQIRNIIEYISELISSHTKRFNSSTMSEGETVGSELFPPCIRAILYRIAHGENLSHTERLSIGFFYLNTNHSIEETVDLFRTSPDFDESLTRYQVEFLAGKGGKGKKYSMYNCAKLKSFHLCKAEDKDFGEDLCQKGAKKRDGTYVQMTNPSKDYLFWKKVELQRLHRSQITVVENEETTEAENIAIEPVEPHSISQIKKSGEKS